MIGEINRLVSVTNRVRSSVAVLRSASLSRNNQSETTSITHARAPKAIAAMNNHEIVH